MGFNIFNIEDVSGNNTGGGPDGWIYEIDLWDHVDEVSADFDEVNLNTGVSQGEAPDGYTWTPLNTTAYGYLATNATTGEWTFFMDRAAVLADGTDQTITFTIEGFDGGSSDDDSVTINILICVCKGTLIQTPEGSRPVEALRTGDLVSVADEDPVTLKWIGSRKVSPYELALNPDLRPIRISKHALGKDTPERDLLVSPNHNILIQDWRAQVLFGENEVLVPAKALVDGQNIVSDMTIAETEYFHLLFDRHQIIWTEGAQTESFYPGPYSLRMLDPVRRFELLEKFPALAESDGYGDTARPCLTTKEGRMLVDDFKDSDFTSFKERAA